MRKLYWIGGGVLAVIIIAVIGYVYFQKRLETPLITEERLEELRTEVIAQNEEVFLKPLFQPAGYSEKNPLKNVYFGELHTHTNLSFDAYIFGNRFTLDQAYHFAKGSSIENSTGEIMRLARPLDFTAVSYTHLTLPTKREV